MQLVAYGAQDLYLTGNPQITFFKTVYRRYTNFSLFEYDLNFKQKPNYNNSVNLIIKNLEKPTKQQTDRMV